MGDLRVWLAAGVVLLGGCGAPTEGTAVPVSSSVMSESDALKHELYQWSQGRLIDEPTLAEYTLQVTGVSVVQESGNRYVGVVYVKPPMGPDHPVSVDIVYDGAEFLAKFQDPVRDFAFLDSLPTR